MKGGGATGLGGFLKEMTLMLRSRCQIREERSFQTEVDRMHGELCGGRGTSEHRDHVKAGEGERGQGRTGWRSARVQARVGQALSPRGGMALRVGGEVT